MGTEATLIAFVCASTYCISTLVGADTIGHQKFINKANRWFVRTFGPVLDASGLPTGKLDYAISFLESLKRVGGAAGFTA